MEMPRLIDKDLLYQIIPRYILRKVTKFDGSNLLI